MTGLNEGKRAVIYARVSTKGQADSGVSIETQLKVCRRWCKQEGMEIVPGSVKVVLKGDPEDDHCERSA